MEYWVVDYGRGYNRFKEKINVMAVSWGALDGAVDSPHNCGFSRLDREGS